MSQREATRTQAEARSDAVDVLVAALARTAQQPEQAAAGHRPRPKPCQVHIEADPRLNAVIVRDLTERLPRYEQLIAALDVEPQSLEIEATIIDVNTDKARELGINWRWNNDGREASFSGSVPTFGAGGVASVGARLGRPVPRAHPGAADRRRGPRRVEPAGGHAVQRRGDVRQQLAPSSCGWPAASEVDLFNVSAGTSLRVTPHVFRDRDQTRIKLLVNVEDGTITSRQVDQIPVVERSTVNTQALIAEGESLLIGGMVREMQCHQRATRCPASATCRWWATCSRPRPTTGAHRAHVPDHAAHGRQPARAGQHHAAHGTVEWRRCAGTGARRPATRAGRCPGTGRAADGAGHGTGHRAAPCRTGGRAAATRFGGG